MRRGGGAIHHEMPGLVLCLQPLCTSIAAAAGGVGGGGKLTKGTPYITVSVSVWSAQTRLCEGDKCGI